MIVLVTVFDEEANSDFGVKALLLQALIIAGGIKGNSIGTRPKCPFIHEPFASTIGVG